MCLGVVHMGLDDGNVVQILLPSYGLCIWVHMAMNGACR